MSHTQTILRLHDRGTTVKDIATRLRCTPKHVYGVLYKNGRSMNQPRFSQREVEQAVTLYLEGKTTREVAEVIGCSHGIIPKWLKKAGVPARPAPPPPPRQAPTEVRDEAVRRYLEGENPKTISQSIEYSAATIRRWVQDAGHTLRSCPNLISKGDKQTGIAMYEDGLTITEIGEALQCNPSTVFRWLKKAGIETTPRQNPVL